MADEALKVQLNIRQNAEELQDMLKELNSWQDEMKIKDEELRHSKIITKKVCMDFVPVDLELKLKLPARPAHNF